MIFHGEQVSQHDQAKQQYNEGLQKSKVFIWCFYVWHVAKIRNITKKQQASGVFPKPASFNF